MNKDLIFKGKKSLDKSLNEFLFGENRDANGVIVPHSKEEFLGSILGQAYSSVDKKRIKKVVVFAPAHDNNLKGLRSVLKIKTLLGEANVVKNDLKKVEGDYSLFDQIVFLQKINPKVEILPLVVGKISKREAKKIAEDFSSLEMIFVFTTNLFCCPESLGDEDEDKRLIKIIENLEFSDLDVCGKYLMMIMKELCIIKNWRPELIKYENFEDKDGDKNIGYASFWF